MTDIVVQDINPRVQYVAGGGGPVTFTFPFPAFAQTDILVFQTPVGAQPNDVTQILVYNVDYTVTLNSAPSVGGSITLMTGATTGDIITIVRDQPDNRLNNYIDGGLFQATTVNTDFDRTVLMNQQNKLYKGSNFGSIGVGYNNSAVITPIVDNVLPILPANCVWMMNSGRTAITAVTSFTGGSGSVTLPSVANKIAYFTNTTGNLASSIFSTPTVDGFLGDSITTNGAGVQQVATIPGKNRVVNGDMLVWQRGAGGGASFAVPASTTQYTADRWQLATGVNQACTVSQSQISPSGYFATVQRNSGQTGITSIFFATTLTVDTCIGAAGKPLSLSFRAFKGANFSAASNIMTASVITGTGTDKSVLSNFTGATIILSDNITLTGSLTQYSATIPAIGSGVTQIAVVFYWIPVGTAGLNDSFNITDIQLEVSAFPTPFERLSFQEVRSKCYPFYQKTFPYSTAPAQNVGVNTGEQIFISTVAGANAQASPYNNFIIPMRVAPNAGSNIITQYSPGAASGEIYDETAAGGATATTAANISTRGFYNTFTGNAGTAVGNVMGIHYTADAELY